MTFEVYMIGAAKGAALDDEIKKAFKRVYTKNGLPATVCVARSRQIEVVDSLARIGLESVEVDTTGGMLSTELWVSVEDDDAGGDSGHS
jgi:hypothetical protein